MKSTIFIMTIIALSSAGVGYGYWDEGLNIDLSIETGSIDPRFVDNNGKTLTVDVEGNPGDVVCITAKIKNRGSIPVESDDVNEIIEPNGFGVYSTEIIIPDYKNNSLVQTSHITDSDFTIEEELERLYPAQTESFSYTIDFKQGL